MAFEIIFSLVIPLIGTILGSACVFFFKKKMSIKMEKIFSGFAAGVMVAATIWSLIIPSFEASSSYGKLEFLPVVVGLWVGFAFLLVLDKIDSIVGIDEKVYGPFRPQDIVLLPKINANIFVKNRKARFVKI